MNDVLIYKDTLYKVFIDFYKKPAIVKLNSESKTLLTVSINKEYVSGDMKFYEGFARWLSDVQTEVEDIVWEWETGKDDVSLIKERLAL